MLIGVKTKPGRRAFTAARGGDEIPSNRYVLVDHTPWIDRLLNVHQDIEREPAPEAKPAAKTPAPPAAGNPAPAA